VCVLQQKQIRKAHNQQQRTRVHESDGRFSPGRQQLIHGSQTMLSGWYSVQQILHDIVWPDICTAGIKHLRWRNSATLQTAKPVNHSEISRDCDNTPSRLHIWDFRVVMLSIALLCRHTASCKCSFGFCIHCWKDCGELVMTSYILLFCDSACDICCIYYLEGLSNVYCCCYAWSIQNTHFAAHI